MTPYFHPGFSGRAGVARRDRPRAFAPQNRRQGECVQSGTMVGVDKVHAGCRNLHEYLSGRGLRLRKISVTKRVPPAGLFDENSFHGV